ncbi:tRNA pseudouridine(38-40) synthase TruA [Candidatus Uabimicrobium sp. HlEnr_7]|uniref:tRNA pseudouridine(38-40) synthase TruA n=1 Tax=Candidatus Uabimicrobium helgolandensis TaxID=3095367 RepID=UPI003557FDEE
MRYFFHIGYCGANYRGWQRQPKSITVQEVIEQSLRKIFGRYVVCMGCGRTDALVHADQYFFHSDLSENWNYDLIYRLNKVLPDDIVVFDIFPVAQKAHAQLSATCRTYQYYIHTTKDPFLSRVSSLYLGKNLHLDLAAQACEILTKYSDYATFCKSPQKHNHTFCSVYHSQLEVNEQQNRIRFTISANRFLRSMIRIIVVRILAVAKKELSLAEFEDYFLTNKSSQFTTIAYPQGLHLAKIEYPFLDIPPQLLRSKELWIDVEK